MFRVYDTEAERILKLTTPPGSGRNESDRHYHQHRKNSMQDHLTSEQQTDIRASLGRYFEEHFDLELNDLQATLLLDYIMTEIAPFAYNRGVDDARAWFAARLDDLPGVCFEQGLVYWDGKAGATRIVRRKNDG